MTLEFRIDEHGYIYLLDMRGKRNYLLVDVPNCPHYGKVKLGELNEQEEAQCTSE